MVLFMSTNSRAGTISNPSGWRLLQARNTATKARVWTKRAVAGDASKVLSVRTTKKVKGTLSISAYRSSAGVSAITATAATTANAAAKTSQAGSWLVNLYAGKSDKPAAFTQATGTARRTSASTAGRGQLAAMVTVHAAAYRHSALVEQLDGRVYLLLPSVDSVTLATAMLRQAVTAARRHLDPAARAAIGPVVESVAAAAESRRGADLAIGLDC